MDLIDWRASLKGRRSMQSGCFFNSNALKTSTVLILRNSQIPRCYVQACKHYSLQCDACSNFDGGVG